MKTELKFVMKYTVASIGSLIILILIWVLTFALSGATAEFLEPPASLIWGCRAIVWLVAIFFPISLVAEFLLIRRLRWPWWMHTPLMATIFSLVGVVLLQIITLVLFLELGDLTASLILAIQDFFWGGAYWLLLRGSDQLLDRMFKNRNRFLLKTTRS